MEIKKGIINNKEKITEIKNYSKRILRILISSLVGIIAGLGMLIVFMFWSMHFIPELSYNESTSMIVNTILEALFILGPQFIAGFISTNIKKALTTAIVVSATLGSILILLNYIQGIVDLISIISGIYLGGYYAERRV
ncbi:MAG: hypothetical protein ACFFDN_33100 [Candidatus Hodarchaeota archaeon]